MGIIKAIVEMIRNYNYCTVEEYKTAIDNLTLKITYELDNLKNNTDVNGDGLISVGESTKYIKTILKIALTNFRGNSKKYWDKLNKE